MAKQTAKEIAAIIAERTGFDVDDLLKNNKKDQLIDMLAGLDNDTVDDGSTDEENASAGESDETQETGHAAEIEAVKVENNKLTFVYNDGTTEVVSFKKTVREYVLEQTRKTEMRLNMINKPTVDEEQTERAVELYHANMLKAVINVDTITNPNAKTLLFANTSREQLTENPAFNKRTLKAIVGAYCNINKIKGLEL